MEKINTKKALFLFYLFIGSTGVVLLTFAWIRRPLNNNDWVNTYLSNFLLNVGSGLVTTAGVTIILSYFFVADSKINEEQLRSYSTQVLERLGLGRYKDNIDKFFLRERQLNHSRFGFSLKDSINLIKISIRPGPVKVGKRNVVLDYFIDLMDTVLRDKQDLDQLVNDMCHLIGSMCNKFEEKSIPIMYDKIVSHKMANPSMALSISHKLNAPCIFFNKEDDYTAGDEITPIEGTLNPGDRVIIVHDVVATGSRIKPMVEYLLKRGAKIEHFFVFAERNDKRIRNVRVRHYFESKNITMHSLHSLNDNQLKIMYEA